LVAKPELMLDYRKASRLGDVVVITSYTFHHRRSVVVANNPRSTAEGTEAATVVVAAYPKDRLADLLWKAEREGLARYVMARREVGGSKRIRTSSLGTSPLGDTISRLRPDREKLSYEDMFKRPDGFSEGTPRYQAARLASRRARAQMVTAMRGQHLQIPDRRVWEELTKAGAPIWQRPAQGDAAAHAMWIGRATAGEIGVRMGVNDEASPGDEACLLRREAG